MTNWGKMLSLDDDNFDEAIPLQIRKERKIEAHKEKMNKYILNQLTKMIIVNK